MQYILLIQGNERTESTAEEWDLFFAAAHASGLFRGGSEIGQRELLGDKPSARPTDHIVGYMRFDAADKQLLLDLLENHPVLKHGGSVELCELPKS